MISEVKTLYQITNLRKFFIYILLILFSLCFELQGNIPSMTFSLDGRVFCSGLRWPFYAGLVHSNVCMMKMNKYKLKEYYVRHPYYERKG